MNHSALGSSESMSLIKYFVPRKGPQPTAALGDRMNQTERARSLSQSRNSPPTGTHHMDEAGGICGGIVQSVGELFKYLLCRVVQIIIKSFIC